MLSTSVTQKYEKPGPTWGPGFSFSYWDLEVHTAHATGRVAGGSRGLLRLVGDDGLGGQEQRRDGRRVLQRRTRHLDRVGNARLEQVLVLTGRGVQAGSGRRVGDLLGDNARLEPTVEGDLLQRSRQRHADDVGASCLVAGELQLV